MGGALTFLVSLQATGFLKNQVSRNSPSSETSTRLGMKAISQMRHSIKTVRTTHAPNMMAISVASFGGRLSMVTKKYQKSPINPIVAVSLPICMTSPSGCCLKTRSRAAADMPRLGRRARIRCTSSVTLASQIGNEALSPSVVIT